MHLYERLLELNQIEILQHKPTHLFLALHGSISLGLNYDYKENVPDSFFFKGELQSFFFKLIFQYNYIKSTLKITVGAQFVKLHDVRLWSYSATNIHYSLKILAVLRHWIQRK